MIDVLGSHNSKSAQITVIVDEPRTSSIEYHNLFSGWQWDYLKTKLLGAGIHPNDCVFICLKTTPIEIIHKMETNIFIAMGEKSLQALTSFRGIDKWHLSPLETKPEFKCRKVIPTYDMGRVQKEYELGLYQKLAFVRAKKESLTTSYNRPIDNFKLNPGLEESISILEDLKNVEEIAVDVETGYGQINTVGFAWSPVDAIAIKVLPGDFSAIEFRNLWLKIKDVLTSDSRKIFQNFIYDVSYFSAYGIKVNNINHDTMWAMKFLWPELDMNLGNVGRLFTERPYWKDDGKVEHEEGKRKDWGNIRDWTRHFIYNCKDTTGTFEAKKNQCDDIAERGLTKLFNDYIMRLTEPIREMCFNGIPIDSELRTRIKIETENKIRSLISELHKEVEFEMNPNSSKQVMKYLTDKGIKLPKKYNKEKKAYKDSVDSASIKKIRLKYPKMKSLALISDIKSLNTALSRYIDAELSPKDNYLRYSLNACGTETLRWSGGKDAWGRGYNIQTIPREGGDVSIKQMFVAPDDWSFLECDLRQAESRFVAYDSADKTLIDMLESNEDVHTYVAKEIVKQMGKNVDDIPKSEFKSTWRQLGKKSGHGFNYAMKESVFVETVFTEMDIVITKKDAELIRNTYYNLFPGIPRWHAGIRKELNIKRKLIAPSGWERYFYGRFGDDMFKEAYAWKPQHTIPWITNHLMLYLMEQRNLNNLKFKLLVQVHDSLIILVNNTDLETVANLCLDFHKWHPEVLLSGGIMRIPTEVKVGKSMDDLKEWGD